ncbi:MAG TPA: ankyrin repeat domain-containing protein [Gemmatimonadaceae bacterium]|nr:ankyrin repeat domain-containing protein [Gemmatimonadaceae bacterium]
MSAPPQSPPTTHLVVRDLDYYDDRAHGLLAVLADGEPGALEQVRAWHPGFAGADDEAIRIAPFTIDDARLVYAREHGFANWEMLGERLRQLADGAEPEPFMAVWDAGTQRDWERGRAILHAHPELSRARGTNGNTLLNLACAALRCPAPGLSLAEQMDRDEEDAERLAPVRALLAMGADANQPNDRGWTPLHQAAYRNDAPMCALLLQAGSRVDLSAHGDGGTPLAVALFWGHRESASLLARSGIVPANLRIAAALGRADLVQHCFTREGALTPAARAARGFYRPHSGFPAWRASDEPQEVLDEALVWAAKSGGVEVMPLLVEHGARVSADPYRGTPLIWAAANGRTAAVRWLVKHGADINQRATFGGPAHGEGVTALHLAAQNDRVEVARLLVSLGADVTIRDALYDATAAGWAEHQGAAAAATYLSEQI